jgi:hypothetical protein
MTIILSDLRKEAGAIVVATDTAIALEVIQARGGYPNLNARLDDISGLSSSQYMLANWMAAMQRMTAAPTPHGTYPDIVGTVAIQWPNGGTGVYTATAVDATWEEVTAWTLTHAAFDLTLTWSGQVRNSNGFITTPGTFAVS